MDFVAHTCILTTKSDHEFETTLDYRVDHCGIHHMRHGSSSACRSPS